MSAEKSDVLIVDDDMDIRLMMQSILKYQGYKTKVCSSADQMYAMLKEVKPGLIIMDMLLSGTDGREICKNLKSTDLTKNISVLMISAHPDAEQTCKLAGADAFLEKPFEIDMLLDKVSALL